MALVLDGVLALGQGVPQLDGLVPRGGDDLPVVGGEGHGQHVFGVVLEPAGGLAGGQVPQPQGLVPGAGQSEVAVRGQNNVGDKVAEREER